MLPRSGHRYAFSVQTRVLGSYASFVATRLLYFTLPNHLLHIIFLHRIDCQCFSFRWRLITFLPTIKSNLNVIHSSPRKMMSKLNFSLLIYNNCCFSKQILYHIFRVIIFIAKATYLLLCYY
jgi:hypothetical protein